MEHHLAWTGFALRINRGPGGALLCAVEDVVTQITTLITSQAEAYIPLTRRAYGGGP